MAMIYNNSTRQAVPCSTSIIIVRSQIHESQISTTEMIRLLVTKGNLLLKLLTPGSRYIVAQLILSCKIVYPKYFQKFKILHLQ